MTDIEKIQKFITENQTLLDEGRWVEFYAILRNYEFIGDVSYMLLKSGIDIFSKPNGLNNIPIKYMYDCNQLTEFILPNHHISRINDNAFLNCKNLELVDLTNNNSLHSIGAAAFSNCINLKRLKLPKSLSVISMAAFLGCENIELIEYTGTKEDWKSKYSQYTGLLIRLKPGCKIILNGGEHTIKKVN